MSQYSSIVNQFIQDTLLPTINDLNLKATSMEEFGYESDNLVSVRRRLSKMVPVYDFLKEYVDGEEECEFSTLTEIISLSGLGSLSSISQQPVVVEPINSNDMSTDIVEDENLSILINGSVYDGSILRSRSYTLEFTSQKASDSIGVSKNGGGYITSSSATVKLINTPIASGLTKFSVRITKNDVIVYTKEITIEAQ